MMMSDYEEMVKLVDGAYKNILEKFNPCARQLISAGKAYLKALHGAMAASKAYIDAIARLARHAHQGTWGGCTDIGTALMQLVDVQKEIQSQQMNILKAFYVDLLVPLESNIDKDSKVVASEQKKFMQQHKTHHEAYLKVASTIKKQRKKNRSSRGPNIEKEIKQMQTLEEEKTKLDGFCENSLKQAITQERRRFGFVLERQCSLAKHYLAYHTKGQSLLQHNIDSWLDIVKTREFLPESIEKLFHTAPEIRITSEYASSGILSDPECARLSSAHASLMRKTRSIDASCLDLRSLSDDPYPRPLSRAKSDFNLASSSASLVSSEYVIPLRPKSMAETEAPSERSQVKALYSYLSSGEHQLSFHEGDIIALIGERNKGWQYGENLRNHRCGWFPIAYTEPIDKLEDLESFLSSPERQRHHSSDSSTAIPSSSSESSGGGQNTMPVRKRPVSGDSGSTYAPTYVGLPSTPAPRRPLSTFADTFLLRQGKTLSSNANHNHAQSNLLSPTSGYLSAKPASSTAATPTTAPATVHPPSLGGLYLPGGLRPPKRSLTSPLPFPLPPPRLPASTSLHSSNDSGFCNDAPPALASSVATAPSSNGGGGFSTTEAEEQEEDHPINDRPRDNIFASVKLRKVITNDRSAPMIT